MATANDDDNAMKNNSMDSSINPRPHKKQARFYEESDGESEHLWQDYGQVDVDNIWKVDLKETTDDWGFVQTRFHKHVMNAIPHTSDTIMGEGETLHEHLKLVHGKKQNTLDLVKLFQKGFNAKHEPTIKVALNLAMSHKTVLDIFENKENDVCWAWEAAYLLFGTPWLTKPKITHNPHKKKAAPRDPNILIRDSKLSLSKSPFHDIHEM